MLHFCYIFFIGWILILIYYVWHFLFEFIYKHICDDMVHIFFDDTFSSAVLLNWIWRDARWELCKSVNVTTSYSVTDTQTHTCCVFLPTKSKNTFFVCWTFWMWLKRGFYRAKRVMCAKEREKNIARFTYTIVSREYSGRIRMGIVSCLGHWHVSPIRIYIYSHFFSW